MKITSTIHVGEGDKVEPRATRELPTGLVVTDVVVGDLYLSAPPRVLRRVAEELLDAAVEAVRREDRITDLRDMQAGVDRHDDEVLRAEYEATR